MSIEKPPLLDQVSIPALRGNPRAYRQHQYHQPFCDFLKTSEERLLEYFIATFRDFSNVNVRREIRKNFCSEHISYFV